MADITLFALGIETLQPGASGSDMSALLDGKASRHAALNWKAGRCHPPQWVLDLLADKIEARYAIGPKLRSAPPRPGKQAGTLNLLRWRARRS